MFRLNNCISWINLQLLIQQYNPWHKGINWKLFFTKSKNNLYISILSFFIILLNDFFNDIFKYVLALQCITYLIVELYSVWVLYSCSLYLKTRFKDLSNIKKSKFEISKGWCAPSCCKEKIVKFFFTNYQSKFSKNYLKSCNYYFPLLMIELIELNESWTK